MAIPITALIIVVINAITFSSVFIDLIAVVVATANLIEKYATRPQVKSKRGKGH